MIQKKLLDEYRVISLLCTLDSVFLVWTAKHAPELQIIGYLSAGLAVFTALNYWCGFPFHGWWKRKNLWR